MKGNAFYFSETLAWKPAMMVEKVFYNMKK
jgi:hypothetical protein